MLWIWRVITILAMIRLLAPPGICLCHADSPVLRIILSVSNPAVEYSPTRDLNEEHHPGCPCSPLSVGLGLVPAPIDAPFPLDICLDNREWLEKHLGRIQIPLSTLKRFKEPPLESGMTPLLI